MGWPSNDGGSVRLLVIHSDRMEYVGVKPIEGLAETGVPTEGHMEECLTVFTTVEPEDDEDAVEDAVGEISEIAERLGVRRVLLYPYAHLSTRLAPPDRAVEVLRALTSALEGAGFDVHRSPFGWYKRFELRAKGHPLAEWSRHITGMRTRDQVKAEIESRTVLLWPDGREVEVREGNWENVEVDDEGLRAMIRAEFGGAGSREPPSIREMLRLELLDYEPAGDSGHFLMYPKGAFMFNTLKSWADRVARDVECMEIDTPIMYDWESPDIREQVETFHERHYRVITPEEKRMVLRFAGDFGLFKMLSRATLSYRDLPIRMYEFSKSFRFEQRGELSGLKRLRAFHMPDIHTFAADTDQGWEEFGVIYRKYRDEFERMGIRYAIAFRVVDEFYRRHKERLLDLLREGGRPVLVEILSEMSHYWAIKTEIQGFDSTGGNCQLGTVQMDVVDASRYGITYVGPDGAEHGCIIGHCSIGSIERWIYILLEEALKMEKPEFPLWIAPTQLRLVPVNDDYLPLCEEIAARIDARVDIDDRDEKVGRRIRDAEREWINMIAVVGEREAASGVLPVRMRDGSIVEMTTEEIETHIRDHTEGWPALPLPLRMHLSRRFPFRG